MGIVTPWTQMIDDSPSTHLPVHPKIGFNTAGARQKEWDG